VEGGEVVMECKHEFIEQVWKNTATQETREALVCRVCLNTVVEIKLKSELLEAQAEIQSLKETYTDENGTVWTRPTAEAYCAVCKAYNDKQAEIERLEKVRDAAIECDEYGLLRAEDFYDQAIINDLREKIAEVKKTGKTTQKALGEAKK
jgi:endo-1,4-beta-mannosidase